MILIQEKIENPENPENPLWKDTKTTNTLEETLTYLDTIQPQHNKTQQKYRIINTTKIHETTITTKQVTIRTPFEQHQTECH